jgi:phenylpropionate dioxygenase-like ring-hydroxylating dioxygenase large terminal subunit
MILDGGLSPETQAVLDQLRVRLQAPAAEDLVSLPPEMYRSQEVYELEVERAFRDGWVCIGRADQIHNPGDYLSIDLLGELLVMTRANSGNLHVLSRVCRHRWMEICQGRGNSRSLVCPYHAWTYELDGRLRGAPEMSKTPGFDRQKCALPSIRHEVWQGIVYVNLNGQAPSLGAQLESLDRQIAGFNLSEWVTLGTNDWGECPWDWKIFMENGECYHHLALHRQTVEPGWPAAQSFSDENNGAYTIVYSPGRPETLIRGDDGKLQMKTFFPPCNGLTDVQRSGFTLIYVLPNYVIALLPDYGTVFRVIPVGPGRIHVWTDTIVPPHVAARADLEEGLRHYGEMFTALRDEDQRACTSVQRGVESRLATPGFLSHLEAHNRDFARWLSARLTGG